MFKEYTEFTLSLGFSTHCSTHYSKILHTEENLRPCPRISSGFYGSSKLIKGQNCSISTIPFLQMRRPIMLTNRRETHLKSCLAKCSASSPAERKRIEQIPLGRSTQAVLLWLQKNIPNAPKFYNQAKLVHLHHEVLIRYSSHNLY